MTRRAYGTIFCCSLFLLGLWVSKGWFCVLYGSPPDVFEIDGFASIWSCMFMIFFGGVMAFTFTIKRAEWIDKRVHIFLIVIAFVISPIMAGGVLYGLNNKASNFTECTELRRSSRLHSSKTYARTHQECQRLVSDRLVGEL